MLARRRVIYYLAIIFVLCSATLISSRIASSGRMVVAPASLNGMVTIAMSSDNKLIFITCEPYHPTLWRRIIHSTLSGAFVVQRIDSTSDGIAHAGSAHIEFTGNLLSVVFADSSQFIFSSEPKKSVFLDKGVVDSPVGIATYVVSGLDTHADFVASRDWTQRSCGL